jgi:hypothetical protein
MRRTPPIRRQALALVLRSDPTAIVCGRSAAWIYGAFDIPEGIAPPLDVTRPVLAPGTPTRGVQRRRLTLRGHRDCVLPLSGFSEIDEDVIELDGLRITSPLRTCFDLMRMRQLVEAVVVADAFAFKSRLPLGLLDGYCSSRHRWPHVRRARRALELAHSGARSPGETRLRMIVVLAGFDEPFVNVPVVDRVSGAVIGVPDLTLNTRGGRLLGIEYDGRYHQDADQKVLDERRQNRLASMAGLPLLRYGRRAVRDERSLIVADVERLSGQRALSSLDDDDFRRPPPHQTL